MRNVQNLNLTKKNSFQYLLKIIGQLYKRWKEIFLSSVDMYMMFELLIVIQSLLRSSK